MRGAIAEREPPAANLRSATGGLVSLNGDCNDEHCLRQIGLIPAQFSSMVTSFRALFIMRTEGKKSVIYKRKRRAFGRGSRKNFASGLN